MSSSPTLPAASTLRGGANCGPAWYTGGTYASTIGSLRRKDGMKGLAVGSKDGALGLRLMIGARVAHPPALQRERQTSKHKERKGVSRRRLSVTPSGLKQKCEAVFNKREKKWVKQIRNSETRGSEQALKNHMQRRPKTQKRESKPKNNTKIRSQRTVNLSRVNLLPYSKLLTFSVQTNRCVYLSGEEIRK
jgi:hypothetical protein